jgi:hypothetical protein
VDELRSSTSSLKSSAILVVVLPQNGLMRMRAILLLMFVVAGRGVTACACRPGIDAWDAAAGTRLEESSSYGDDRVAGLLHVTTREAYFDYESRRILLIAASPMTAAGSEALMAQTAGDLQHLSDKRVQARGDLQGSIFWGAQVTPLE